MQLLLLLLYLFHVHATDAAESKPHEESKKLFEDYWNWRLSDMPQFATTIGIHDYNTELNDLSEEAYQKRLEDSHLFLKRANSLEPLLENENDIEDMKILKYELELFIGSWDFKGYYLAMNYMEGPQKYDSELFSYMPRNDREDFEIILKRLEKLPRQIDQIIDLLKAGVMNNITLHSKSLKNMTESLGRFAVEDPELSPFYNIFKEKIYSTSSDSDILEKALLIIKTQVSPAYDKLRKYIVNEYVPRENISIASIRNGKKFYEACIWYQTSTNLSASEIHQMGKDEVERLQREMKKIVEKMGFQNLSVPEFSNMIRDDPKNFFNSSQDLLNEFERIVYEVIPPHLKSIFKSLPRSKLRVEGDDSPNGMKAYYVQPNLKEYEPGKFVFNSYDPRTQPKYDMLTLALHEGEPGHHLQISHQLESENLPQFRRFRDTSNTGMTPSRFPHYAFFVEGWGLYAETLGYDMKLFGNPLDEYGHYSMKIYRACRLVVDTGLHAFGWTREEAVNYMFTKTASTRPELENEIDRYITWPGQALSYMIGEMKLRKLRQEAQDQIQDRFYLKEFHKIILDSFGPLNIVEKQVRKWIKNVLDSHSFFQNYWQWKLQDKPEFAFQVGHPEYDGKLNDLSEEAFENRYKKVQEFSEQAKLYDSQDKSLSDSNSLNKIKHELETFSNFYSLKGFYLPINFLEGPQNYASVYLKMMPLETQKDYEIMLNVMRNIPKKIDQIIDLMKQGMRNNITNHESSIKPLEISLGDYIVQEPQDSPFFNYFATNFPTNFTSNQIQNLQQQATSLISNQIVPAYKKLKDFVAKEYVPRSQISVTTVKDGELFYKGCIKFHTGTDMTAEEIHQIGVDEVERIGKKMQEIVNEMGFSNMTTQKFSDYIRKDPNNYYNSSEEMIERFRYIAKEIIEPKLSSIFGTLPKSKFEIRGYDSPGGRKAFYTIPSLSGTRPGIFWINVNNPKSRPKYEMLTVSLHEGSPGHHLQLSLKLESKVPNFRKISEMDTYGTVPSNFPFYDYNSEGWALYAETLGFDMGLYKDPLDKYGHYSMKMKRACRLVVDTGMHALGWTKDEAFNYMINHTASTKSELEVEINRIIAWPGQALSYMIGEIKIKNLRKEAEERLGGSFDIKYFHESILNYFGPLDGLEKYVRVRTDVLKDLYNNIWNYKLLHSPQFSTFVGHHVNNTYLDEEREIWRNQYLYCNNYLFFQICRYEYNLKEDSEEINLNILRHECLTINHGLDINGDSLILNSFEGPQRYPETLFRRMPRTNHNDYSLIIERIEKLPQQINWIIDSMDRSMYNGRRFHEMSMRGLNESLRRFIVEDPKMSPLYQKFFVKDFPKDFSRDTIFKLKRSCKSAIKNKVVPAFKKLHYYVTEEYLTREHIQTGFYESLIFFHTSSNYSAEEIHDIGLIEVERIEKEMQNVLSEMGLRNTSVREFSDKIRNDPENYYETSEDLLNDVKEKVERIYPLLKKLFHTIPKGKLEFFEDRTPNRNFASYVPASLDGTVPGEIVINTHDLKSRPKYDLLTLILHEGIPGHHFRSSYSIESFKFQNFRKIIDTNYYGIIPSHFPVYSYFTNGWALYAESLGFEMELFNDPLERYGHYSAEMLRACRLVVDTGFHALGWTKEKALEFMLRYTAFPKIKLENEIVRYITWPGEALSYKMGEMKIRQLREEAQNELGNKFNIKDFHEVVLDSLGPLEIVEKEVQKWIDYQRNV